MLHVSELTYRIGERVLLDRASFAIPDGARVGLVGRNGSGKTTLFRIVQGEIAPEGGQVTLPRNLRIGAVAQEAPDGPEPLIDVVLAADAERSALLAEAEHAGGLRRAEIETRLIDIGAHSAPARAASILHGLGFEAEAQARPCASFSGGWRMRVALASVLFTEPDLLLLDEPTNYLDLEGTLWLYDYLGRYPHTVLIISPAYFAQHQLDELREGATPYLHVAERMPDRPEARIRARCGRLGFPGAKADTPVSALSGGEKARLLMGLAAFDAPHLLILDEPTNHLDIDSRAALMEAINDYEGAVILVSHDRFLIEACADRLWLVAAGTVKPFDGDLDDYRRLVLAGELEPAHRSSSGPAPYSRTDDRRAAAERRAALAPVRKRLEAVEARIGRLSAAIAKIDVALADGTAFRTDPAKAGELAKKRAEAAEALAGAEEDWLALSGELEQATA